LFHILGEQKVKKDSIPEGGFITGRGLIGILISIVIIYGAVAFFPVASVPFGLEGEVKKLSKDWLKKKVAREWRTKSQSAKKSDLKTFIKDVKQAVAQTLSGGHEYDEKNLEIRASVRSNNVTVDLPYTIVINFLGMDFRFEKELLIEERAWQF